MPGYPSHIVGLTNWRTKKFPLLMRERQITPIDQLHVQVTSIQSLVLFFAQLG